MDLASVKLKIRSFTGRADRGQRVESAIVFAIILGLFCFAYFIGAGVIDAESLFGKCGFKQYHGFACPFCGFTTAAAAFTNGKILSAFYLQPAAGIIYSLLAILGVLSLLTACFGVDFHFLPPIRQWRASYIVAAVVVIIAFGWAVVLIRN